MHGPGAPATRPAVINSSPRSEFQDALSEQWRGFSVNPDVQLVPEFGRTQ